MRPTIRLGTISGINIGLHWSIVLIAGILTFTLAGTILPATAVGYGSIAYLLAALATAGLFFGSIVAHELGHSIVAQRNDIGVKQITLFALGGVAVLEDEPRSPGASARIALAGPAVSVGLGVASLVAASAMSAIGVPALVVGAFLWLGFINLALAVFNMLPALPLDGGRVLQAGLWKRREGTVDARHRATISAARLGRYLGLAIAAVGVWQFVQTGDGLWTAFIGWFVMSSASAEASRARKQIRQGVWARRFGQVGHRRRGHTVVDVDHTVVDHTVVDHTVVDHTVVDHTVVDADGHRDHTVVDVDSHRVG